MRELGDDLRNGNEDLEPVVRFMAWHSGRWAGDTVLRLKVGMDIEDAVDNGILLEIKCNVYAYLGTAPHKKLLTMGFPVNHQEWLYNQARGGWCTTFDFSFKRAQAAEREAEREELDNRKRQRLHSPERPPVIDPEVAEMLRRRRQGLPFE